LAILKVKSREGFAMGRGGMFTEILKECMADALLRLMREKPLDRITFREIAAEAGVGRASWFRNFSSKEEALSFKLVRLWKRWAAEQGFSAWDHYTIENAGLFFQFNFSIRETLRLIYRAQCSSCVYDAFYRLTCPQPDAGPHALYEIRFYTLGLYGLLSEWAARDFQETPEEMTEIFTRIMRQPAPSSASFLEKRN